MWWHADNSSYGLLLQGLATSPTAGGPYTFVNASSPLGNWSQDFGLFTDYKDGRSYALYSNGDRREGRDVYVASYDKDVGALERVVHRFDKYDLEAPCIVQTESSYYALMSHKTGYRPNSESHDSLPRTVATIGSCFSIVAFWNGNEKCRNFGAVGIDSAANKAQMSSHSVPTRLQDRGRSLGSWRPLILEGSTHSLVTR